MSSGFIEKNQNNTHNCDMEDRHKQKLSYPLRMPDELRTRLENEAAKIGRSLHAEIVARLEKSFIEEPIEPTSLAGIQQQIHGLVDENIKMRELLMEHLEFIGVTANSDEKSK